MKRLILIVCLVGFGCLCARSASAQTDEIRQATGLPIPIGAPVIYGEVSIRGLPADQPRPLIYVSLFLAGIQVDRMQPNDRGFYYFLRSASDGATLVFEANTSEIGRIVLSAGGDRIVRRDIYLDWPSALASKSAPGVISVKNAYSRSPEANKALDQAMAAARTKKTDAAMTLFNQVVEKDPKDFVAWTEIGTLYFDDSKYGEAESAYAKALEQKSDFMPALMNLGKLYLSQKKFEMAISVFLMAARSEPTSAEAFQYLGEAYLQAKQGTNAVTALNEAIRLAPIAMADIHLRLAALYNAAGAQERAATEYKRFLEKRPNHPDRQKLEAYIRASVKPGN